MSAVTVSLTYKREWEAKIPELWALAEKLYDEKGTETIRVLREGEERDPFPIWMRTVLKRRGYKYEWFNARYAKKIEGGNADLVAHRVEKERLWLLKLIQICECPSMLQRVSTLLFFQPLSIFTLGKPDTLMAPLPEPPVVADAVSLNDGEEYVTRGGWIAKPTGKRIEQKPWPAKPIVRIWWRYDHGEDHGGMWNHNPDNGCTVWTGGKHATPHDLVAAVGKPIPQPPKPRQVQIKAAQLARVTAAYVDGIEYEVEKAADVEFEEQNF